MDCRLSDYLVIRLGPCIPKSSKFPCLATRNFQKDNKIKADIVTIKHVSRFFSWASKASKHRNSLRSLIFMFGFTATCLQTEKNCSVLAKDGRGSGWRCIVNGRATLTGEKRERAHTVEKDVMRSRYWRTSGRGRGEAGRPRRREETARRGKRLDSELGVVAVLVFSSAPRISLPRNWITAI